MGIAQPGDPLRADASRSDTPVWASSHAFAEDAPAAIHAELGHSSRSAEIIERCAAGISVATTPARSNRSRATAAASALRA